MSQVSGKFIKQSEINHQSINGKGYYDHAFIDAFINNFAASQSFPMYYVGAGITLTIPYGFENIVTDYMEIDGELVIDGRCSII